MVIIKISQALPKMHVALFCGDRKIAVVAGVTRRISSKLPSE